MVRELTVDAAGCRLFVRDWGGDGTPILLLHGGGADVSTWDGLAPLLAGDFRTVAYDARGHGQSEVPAGGGRAALLEDVAAVTGALELERPLIVGHSMGGATALRYVRGSGDSCGVVCIDGAIVRTDEPIARANPNEYRTMLREFGVAEERVEFFLDLRLSGEELAAEETVAIYDDITCPLLLLFAERGLTNLGPYTNKQREAIAALRVPTRWFDTGHGIHEERPGEVAAAIREFLASF
jgi:pimeloyl-ACP methyl ester carboxylesterase